MQPLVSQPWCSTLYPITRHATPAKRKRLASAMKRNQPHTAKQRNRGGSLTELRPPRRGEVNHSQLVRVANVDLPYEHAQKCGPLAALMLAHNLFGDSFFEARCSLGAKTAGHFL
jgi:hypothetical protein